MVSSTAISVDHSRDIWGLPCEKPLRFRLLRRIGSIDLGIKSAMTSGLHRGLLRRELHLISVTPGGRASARPVDRCRVEGISASKNDTSVIAEIQCKAMAGICRRLKLIFDEYDKISHSACLQTGLQNRSASHASLQFAGHVMVSSVMVWAESGDWSTRRTGAGKPKLNPYRPYFRIDVYNLL
jgi:hypothetical protein